MKVRVLLFVVIFSILASVGVSLWCYGKHDIKKVDEITEFDLAVASIFYDGYLYVEKENYISVGAITSYLANKFGFEPQKWGIGKDYVCRVYVGSWLSDFLDRRELNRQLERYNTQLMKNLPTNNPSQQEIIDAMGKTLSQLMQYDMCFEGKSKSYKLAQGRGYCIDYAYVIKELCNLYNIPCEYVLARCHEKETYHIFNAAYINGDWMYLDGTSLAFVPEHEQESLYVGDVIGAKCYPEYYILSQR